MAISVKKTYNTLLGWGLVILAIGTAFPQDIMHAGFALLLIAFLIQFFKGNLKFMPTGLEVPLVLFFAAGILSSLFSSSPAAGISYFLQRFWYAAFIYIAVYMFQEKELKKFTRFIAWAGIGVAIYSILQSLIGLNFNLEFKIGELVSFSPPELKEIFSIGSHPVYIATGIIGKATEFGAQLLMLMFFVYGAFRKQWGLFLVFIGLLLTFVYQAWIGLFAVAVYLMFSKKRYLQAASVFVFLSVVFLLLPQVSFNTAEFISVMEFFKSSPLKILVGAGPGQFREVTGAALPNSLYLRILAEGGIISLAALILLIFNYYKRYFSVPPSTKEIWRKIHYGCVLAVTAILVAAFILPVPVDPVNAMLFWTLAGIGIKTKQGGWTRRLVSGYGSID